MSVNKKLLLTRLPHNQKDALLTALVDEKGALELRVGSREETGTLGNIYVAQVENIAENIQAAFVLIQKGQRCYLPLKEASQAIYAGTSPSGRPLRPGDQILVQVCREAMKTKVPSVTTNLNFTGKYLVLTSGDRRLGISSKLNKETTACMKHWFTEWKKDSYGLIVRTNAAEATKEELQRELRYLENEYEKVTVYGKSRTCFSLLHKAEPFYLAAIRDTYSQTLTEIVTDDKSIYENVQEYLKENQPEDLPKLRFYQDELLPLHKLYRLEIALEEAQKEKIWLKSGGFLIIQPTEAFVSIDVNSGKYTDKKKAEEAYRKINREAAEEIARQLRLRNLSGVILIDFINMTNPDHQDELLHLLARHFRKDPVKTTVVDMTALQIVEVTRKKVRRTLKEDLALYGKEKRLLIPE